MFEQGFQHSRVNLPIDAFSSGQVGSKIWLCEKLETVLEAEVAPGFRHTIWIYGGWQGVLGYTLLCRPAFKNANVRSFDADAASTESANILCENWVWRDWQFRAFTSDCNKLAPDLNREFGDPPTIILNTSVEHFESNEWFQKIPEGTLVVLQASDFDHDGAVALFSDEQKFSDAFPLRKKFFVGKMQFKYETWSFNRLMLIGVR